MLLRHSLDLAKRGRRLARPRSAVRWKAVLRTPTLLRQARAQLLRTREAGDRRA